ncbi:hypothetical protein IFHNHDMJ_02144 [Synechococcus sp. CBW1107]|nr:hypothetical protein IFHNHDMJ_02144 [Synechococcus sp. CBW1107]
MRDTLLEGIQPRLDVSFSKDPSGVSLNVATVGLPGCDDPDAPLTPGIDDDEEPAPRLAVETKAILADVAAAAWRVDCLRVEERLRCETEVEATLLENLVAFSLIPLKLQILQGLRGACSARLIASHPKDRRVFHRVLCSAQVLVAHGTLLEPCGERFA